MLLRRPLQSLSGCRCNVSDVHGTSVAVMSLTSIASMSVGCLERPLHRSKVRAMTSFLLSMVPTIILTFDYVFYTLLMRQLCVLKKELGFFQFLYN